MIERRYITSLTADRPLTKVFKANGQSEPYPLVRDFTSMTIEYRTIQDLLEIIQLVAQNSGCLLKGHLTRQITSESRAGLGDATSNTDWIVLDYDSDGGFESVDAMLAEVDPILPMTDYIFQHSASSGITGKTGIRGHVFFLLTEEVSPNVLKQWVRKVNLTSAAFKARIKLSRNAMSLCYALDTTVNQNDKLIYITPPTLIDIEDPVKKRFELHLREYRTYTFNATISAESNRAKEIELIQTLQDRAGVAKRTPKYTTVGSDEILTNPGQCSVTGVKKGMPYTRINLNGGDSWAYWYYTDNPEVLYNYKGEPSVYLKDIAPDYYAQVQQAELAKSERPFIFRELSRDQYYNAIYDESTGRIVCYHAVGSIKAMNDFMLQRGAPPPKVIPDWEIKFDPTDRLTVDFLNKKLNTFNPTKYMDLEADDTVTEKDFPTISRVIRHICVDQPTYDHFLAWVAHIVQFRTRTQTAWLFSGIEGCLAGDTVVGITRGKRSGVGDRPRTLEYIYNKWAGIKGKAFDRAIQPTRMMACKDELTIGLHEVHDIYQSGIKPVWRLTTMGGHTIKATAEHPFMRPDKSMTKLGELRPGDEVVMQGDRRQFRNGCGKGRNTKRRTVHGVQYHPFAWRHVINGKNYKRIHYARLVYEAALNGIPVGTMIDIVRNRPDEAAQLLYMPATEIVHHMDEDPTNDALENLVAIDKENHDRHHARHTGLGTHVAITDIVSAIEYVGEEMTYDITMKAPYHNFVANGFVVSNTGKGLTFTHVLQPLIGEAHAKSINQDNLEEQFNGYFEDSLLTFIDEGEIANSKLADKMMAKLRGTITEPTITIRKMRMNAYPIHNFTNIIIATNRSMAIRLQQSDRRWNIAPRQHLRFIPSDEDIAILKSESELPAFTKFVKALSIKESDSTRTLCNQTKDDLLELSKTVADEFFVAIKEGDLDYFAERLQEDIPMPENGYIAYAKIIQGWMQNAVSGQATVATMDDLVKVYEYCSGNPLNAKRFSHLAGRQELRAEQKRINGIQRRVYTIPFRDNGYELWLQRNKRQGVAILPSKPMSQTQEVSANG